MEPLNYYFTESTRRSLYHYTGIRSLLGMAQTRSIWASNSYYLNDSKEIIHACEIVDAVLGRHLSENKYEGAEKDFVEQFRRWIQEFRAPHCIFVFSLSEHQSLGQWRGYTPHGKGVCLEFSAAVLDEIASAANFRIHRCLYEPHEHAQVVDQLIESMLLAFRTHLPQPEPDMHINSCYYSFLLQHTERVLQLLAVIKHTAFKEEREWRLISKYYPSYKDKRIKFREGSSMLVPYVEIPMPTNQPMFNSVTLGPSAHVNLSMHTLTMFCTQNEISYQIINSMLPYREWP